MDVGCSLKCLNTWDSGLMRITAGIALLLYQVIWTLLIVGAVRAGVNHFEESSLLVWFLRSLNLL